MVVAHFSVDFGLWHEGGHGVDYDDVDGAGADERFGDVKGLFASVWLGNEEGFDVDTELAGVDRVEGMFRIDEGCDSAEFLGFGDGVQGKRRLAGRFGTVDFDDAAAGEASHAESHVELDAPGRDDGDLFDGLLSESHDGTFTIVLFDLRNGGFDRLCLVGGKVACGCRVFLCHIGLHFLFFLSKYII